MDNPYLGSSISTDPSRQSAAISRLTRVVVFASFVSLALHGLLWIAAVTLEPFRKIYFGFHLADALLLSNFGLSPREPSLGYFIATLPLAGAVLHTALVALGTAIGGVIGCRWGSAWIPRGGLLGGVITFILIGFVSAVLLGVGFRP